MTDAFDDLDEITLDIIGDDILYKQPLGENVTIKAWADHSDVSRRFGASAGVTGDATIEIRVADVAQPTRDDIITLPRTGLFYRPSSYLRSPSGRMWRITLKRHVD
jgi:hypothetical protein